MNTHTLAELVSFWYPIVAGVMYAAVALLWLVPDRRIEKGLDD